MGSGSTLLTQFTKKPAAATPVVNSAPIEQPNIPKILSTLNTENREKLKTELAKFKLTEDDLSTLSIDTSGRISQKNKIVASGHSYNGRNSVTKATNNPVLREVLASIAEGKREINAKKTAENMAQAERERLAKAAAQEAAKKSTQQQAAKNVPTAKVNEQSDLYTVAHKTDVGTGHLQSNVTMQKDGLNLVLTKQATEVGLAAKKDTGSLFTKGEYFKPAVVTATKTDGKITDAFTTAYGSPSTAIVAYAQPAGSDLKIHGRELGSQAITFVGNEGKDNVTMTADSHTVVTLNGASEKIIGDHKIENGNITVMLNSFEPKGKVEVKGETGNVTVDFVHKDLIAKAFNGSFSYTINYSELGLADGSLTLKLNGDKLKSGEFDKAGNATLTTNGKAAGYIHRETTVGLDEANADTCKYTVHIGGKIPKAKDATPAAVKAPSFAVEEKANAEADKKTTKSLEQIDRDIAKLAKGLEPLAKERNALTQKTIALKNHDEIDALKLQVQLEAVNKKAALINEKIAALEAKKAKITEEAKLSTLVDLKFLTPAETKFIAELGYAPKKVFSGYTRNGHSVDTAEVKAAIGARREQVATANKAYTAAQDAHEQTADRQALAYTKFSNAATAMDKAMSNQEAAKTKYGIQHSQYKAAAANVKKMRSALEVESKNYKTAKEAAESTEPTAIKAKAATSDEAINRAAMEKLPKAVAPAKK